MEYFKYKYDDLFNPVLEALHTLGGSPDFTNEKTVVASYAAVFGR